MSSFQIADDDFDIDDSEFAVLKPTAPVQTVEPAPRTQTASQRLLAQRQQQNEIEQSQQMQAQGRHVSQPNHAQAQPPRPQPSPQSGEQQQQRTQFVLASQQTQESAHNNQQPVVNEEYVPQWQATNVDSKFNPNELNSIKTATAAKQTMMSGHKTQETARIAINGSTIDQSESIRLGSETMQKIRGLKQTEPLASPTSEPGLLDKLRKLFHRQ